MEKTAGQALGLHLKQTRPCIVIRCIEPGGAAALHKTRWRNICGDRRTYWSTGDICACDVLKLVNGSGPAMSDIMAAWMNACGSVQIELARPFLCEDEVSRLRKLSDMRSHRKS